MKLVVGISGASGATYGLRILEVLKQAGVETHLVMSDSAKRTIVYETDYTVEQVKSLTLEGPVRREMGKPPRENAPAGWRWR